METFGHFLKQKKKKKEQIREKKEVINRLIKDRIIRYIRTLCEQEKAYLSLEEKVISEMLFILNIKVMVIKLKLITRKIS